VPLLRLKLTSVCVGVDFPKNVGLTFGGGDFRQLELLERRAGELEASRRKAEELRIARDRSGSYTTHPRPYTTHPNHSRWAHPITLGG